MHENGCYVLDDLNFWTPFHAYSLLYSCLLLSRKFQPQYTAVILAKKPNDCKQSCKGQIGQLYIAVNATMDAILFEQLSIYVGMQP